MQQPIDLFPSRRILIVGDLMLDEYVWGTVRRISPEAPVPIVELNKRSHAPGGAANAAVNATGLHGAVQLVGVVGNDAAGRTLIDTIQSCHIHTDGIIIAPGRPTTTKMRIIAHHQQVVRLDHEQRTALASEVEQQVINLVLDRLPGVHACILSDYDKGTVTPRVARAVIDRCLEMQTPVVVDPKGADYLKYRGVTVAKPNLHEAGVFLKRPVESAGDIEEAGDRLLEFLESRGILLTSGAAGMTLFEPGKSPMHIAAQAREVYDVTGAGDTVVSTLAMSLAAGSTLEQAARLSSRAAAIVVGRLGTASIRREDLMSETS